MRTTLVLVLCLAGASCTKKPADPDVVRPSDAPTQVVIAGDGGKPAAAPMPPAPVEDCKVINRRIMSNVRRAYSAMDAGPPRREALKQWPAVSSTCRNGTWFLAAALLIDLGEKEMSAGPTKLTTEEEALTAALALPDDVVVLARVALVSALGKSPKLPDDACKRAQAAIGTSTAREDQDAAAYVCARAAIAAKDGKTATEQLAAIKAPREVVDFELARAQAARLLKDARTQSSQARIAARLEGTRAMMGMIPEGDRLKIIAIAKQLTAGK